MSLLASWTDFPWACVTTLLVTGLACLLLASKDERDPHHGWVEDGSGPEPIAQEVPASPSPREAWAST